MDRQKKKRPAIGFMTGNLHFEQPKYLVEELIRQMKAMDIDLHLYLGSDPSAFLGDYATKDIGFLYHYYSLYSYSKFEDLDLLVIAFGGLTVRDASIGAGEFLRGLPDIPIILMENEDEVEGTIRLDIDNFGGMKKVVDYLIEVSKRATIAYIDGPQKNMEARRRRLAYEASLKEHGMTVQPELIAQGDFSDQVDMQVEELLAKNPSVDAIVCANDSMAVSAYRVLKRHGIQIGREVAVTGFDDMTTARYMEPPLASVSQDYERIVREILGQVEQFLEGIPMQQVMVPVRFCPRESIGGNPEDLQTEARAEEHRRVLENQEEIKKTQLRFMTCSLVLRNLLMQSFGRQAFFERLGEQLSKIGTKRSYICVMDRPIARQTWGMTDLPDELRLVLKQEGNRIFVPKEGEAEFVHAGELRKYLEAGEQTVFVDFILFYKEIQYGILCLEIDIEDVLFYHTLSLDIGSGLRYMDIAMGEQEMRMSLAEKIQTLDYTASHDVLTGLWNRVGILEQMNIFVAGHPSGECLVAVMADLDHLKQINDTFGHEEGDYAIRQAAHILKESLANGMIGRTGGDEFMGVFRASAKENALEFVERVKRECKSLNQSSGKPYYVELSVGLMLFGQGEGLDLETALKKADDALYLEKKKRRKSVIR